MTPSIFHQLLGYLVAAGVVIFATVVRGILDPFLDESSALVTYIFAIVIAAWYGGLGPGLFAMVLGLASAAYFFLTPRGSIQVHQLPSQVGVILYLFVGLSSAILSELMRRERRRARNSAAELLLKQSRLEHEILERRIAQDAHVRLLHRINELQEDDRRRISRELHDQCGQFVTGIRLGLKFLAESRPQDQDVASQCLRLQDLLDQIAKEIHDIALELRPPSLDELGLITALESYLRNWSNYSGIAVDHSFRGMDGARLKPEVETALYRVIQESLTNVAKHAGAKQVSVIIERTADQVTAIVEDQGAGFNTEEQLASGPARQRLGLLGMRERMSAVGGTLNVESSLGAGSTVYAKAPL